MIGEALPWTVGTARPDHAVLVRRRHAAGRAAGVARSAALAAMAHAAAMGAARHPVLPARPGADVAAGVPVPAAADLRRLQRRRAARPETAAFILDVLRHAVLPALSIVLVSVGGWALAMRGMMVTTMGEDYVTFAEAKGLRSRTDLHALLHAQRDPAADHRAGAGARPDPVRRGAGGGDLRLSRHRRAAVPGDRGERLLPDPGHRVHRHRRRSASRRSCWT